MEERIKAQRALVDDLDRSGQGTSAAVRRLTLLLSTLKEMRVQLALLAETEMDKKNSRADVLVSRLLGKGVALTPLKLHANRVPSLQTSLIRLGSDSAIRRSHETISFT